MQETVKSHCEKYDELKKKEKVTETAIPSKLQEERKEEEEEDDDLEEESSDEDLDGENDLEDLDEEDVTDDDMAEIDPSNIIGFSRTFGKRVDYLKEADNDDILDDDEDDEDFDAPLDDV
ncbi:uncharacterized protein T551_01989 [Pneumocystis jirovecii RU7]|uniref:Histone chaperone domain-containing protein n=1 Tax=Pneumocystis jirovecii (strain RU7) TaxID=1408657 RepID=A0A0W4ZNV0_PNEJ7|nr:uncharacterized protein T551_01989 [Pneumocystis jirovecii RU7]KTW30045.1 hypothetical protein T551_01989 [Pneumocystis jirovecii RU7]